MESIIYNQKGEQKGKIKLSEGIFGLPWNGDLVHQIVTSILSSARKPWAHTKNRGDVSGGGKKPWKQKGTGRARHGSSRSPIWVGGGVAHGPRNEKNYDRKVNKKMKVKALFTILSKKFKDGEVIFVDSIKINEPKTKEAVAFREALSSNGFEKLVSKKTNSAYINIPTRDEAIMKSFRNIENITLDVMSNINLVDLLNYKYLIIVNPEESLKVLEAKIANKKIAKTADASVKENTEKKVVKKTAVKKPLPKKLKTKN